MPTKLEIQQESQRVMQCLEDPLISAAFPEEICAATTISRDEYLTCVAHEQALARCKCEQELVRLDEGIARLDEGIARLDEARLDEGTLESFDISFNTCEVLAALRFLYENRRINVDALIDAAKTGQASVVEMLLAFVDPSANRNEAIRWASVNGHSDVVKVLLADSRVDPAAYDNEAIRWASADGRTDVVKLLIADLRVDPSAYGCGKATTRRCACGPHATISQFAWQVQSVIRMW